MSIFDRLSRLARAEANHWRKRARDPRDDWETEPLLGEDEVESLVDEAPRPPRDEPRPDPYPREIREAYATLELPLGADRAEARAAYRRLLGIHHPDRHAHHDDDARERDAHERTMAIRTAWERLDRWLP